MNQISAAVELRRIERDQRLYLEKLKELYAREQELRSAHILPYYPLEIVPSHDETTHWAKKGKRSYHLNSGSTS